MSPSRIKRQDALRQLEESLVQLSEVRITTPRSEEFKQWHEGVYQLAQRIWPRVKDRAARVARIPFRPGSSRANEEQKKEIFERGCAEAGVLLRKWITEIQDKGIISAEPDEDDVQTVEETPAAAAPAAPPAPAPVPPGIKPVTPTAPPKPAAPAASHPIKPRPAAAHPPKNGKGQGKKRLKDMLGLDQLEASLGLQWKDDGDDAAPPAAPVPQAPPAPVQQAPPAPVQQAPPAPVPQAPPAPVQQAPPAPVQQAPPAPVKQAPPAPVKQTPSGITPTTPMVQQAPPAPVKQTPSGITPVPTVQQTPSPATDRVLPTAEDLGLDLVTTGPLRPRTRDEDETPFMPPRGRSSFDAIEIEPGQEAVDTGSPTVIWSPNKTVDLPPSEDAPEVVMETPAEHIEEIEPPVFKPAADLAAFIRPEEPAVAGKRVEPIEPEPPGLVIQPAGLTELPRAPIVEPEPVGLSQPSAAVPAPEPPLDLITQAPPAAAPRAQDDDGEEVEPPLFQIPELDGLLSPVASPPLPVAETPTPAAPPPAPVAETPRPVAPPPPPVAVTPTPVAPSPPPASQPVPAAEAVTPTSKAVEIEASDEASPGVALIALAQEIERSNLPRRRREQLIEHLATIAGQVEEGGLEWAEVEDAIVLVMKHPDIARRLVPVLARLLDQAA